MSTTPRAAPGCTGLGLFVVFLVLLPFFLANAVFTALGLLGLTPMVSVAVALGIFLGSAVNIPVRRVAGGEEVALESVVLFGLGRVLPRLVRRRRYTVIAVNIGGAVIPTLVAVYQLVLVAEVGASALGAAALAIAINTAVCWRVSRAVPRVGMTMNPILPPVVAAASALILAPAHAPNVAFAAGVLGPLIGADLLHLGDVSKLETGVASIGGAGTFDGIVLSGLFATLLA